MDIVEYPKMLYKPGTEPIIVQDQTGEVEKLNEGWSTSPVFKDERELLIMKIKEYRAELTKLEDRLDILNARMGTVSNPEEKTERSVDEELILSPVEKKQMEGITRTFDIPDGPDTPNGAVKSGPQEPPEPDSPDSPAPDSWDITKPPKRGK